MEELYCHECSHYVRFETKPEKTGNLIIVCDKCGHQHCRTVVNGKITEDRWDARNNSENVDPRWSAVHGESIWKEEQRRKSK